MSTPSKKSRSSNFTKEEELLLLSEINIFKNVIECKTTNKISWTEKENAWKAILESFSAKNYAARTVDQIKAKYINLKTRARKEVAKVRGSYKGTGGGPPVGNLDSSCEAVLDMLNIKTVVGLQSRFDSDADVNMDTHNKVNYPIPGDEEDKIVSPNETITSHEVFDNEIVYLASNPVLGSTPLENCVEKESSKDWSNYVPSKLKARGSSKLRPKVLNPAIEAKQAYYKRKLQILNKQEEREVAKEEREVLKYERDSREQELRMKLLELDYEIKKKQL